MTGPKNRPGPRRADEFLAELKLDPEYQARKKAFDEDLEQRVTELAVAQHPLLEDLASAGIEVDSVWRLHKAPPEQRLRACPILLKHLDLDYPDKVLEGIAVALHDKSYRPWWANLRARYLSTEHAVVRDRLAAVLSTWATKEHYEDLLSFVRDETLGDSRIYFLRPIHRIGNRISSGQGRAIISTVADDPILGTEATLILKGRGPND